LDVSWYGPTAERVRFLGTLTTLFAVLLSRWVLLRSTHPAAVQFLMSAPFPTLKPSSSHSDAYKDGTYLRKNPTWHVEESPFKVKYILRLLHQNSLEIHSVCEAGCGVGEVLRLLQLEMPADTDLTGFDISPQAHELSKPRANAHLRFKLADVTQQSGLSFDLLLVLDVVEHLEDYFSFLRAVRTIARHKVFHFPLDLSVQAVIRSDGLLKRRRDHHHVHYFSKETALETLTDTGYKIVDYFYAPRSNELGPHLVQKLFRLPRSAFFAIQKDFAVRLLGGYSLMILAD
jgi:SAM-dependent methyltransferase